MSPTEQRAIANTVPLTMRACHLDRLTVYGSGDGTGALIAVVNCRWWREQVRCPLGMILPRSVR